MIQFSKIASTYNEYLDTLYSYALHLGFDEQTAMDAIHDVFHKLCIHHSSLNEINNLKPYLFRSLRNRLIDIKRISREVYSDNGTFHTQKVDVTPFIGWKDGYLSFEDTPVTEALKQIERYYNFSFNYGKDVSFRGLTCTGKIILSDNLDNVMTALTLISATKYKKEDKLIYIYKE